MANQIILNLLQFIALIVPGIAIYMNMAYGESINRILKKESSELEDGLDRYHMGRLAIIFLLISGASLLLQIWIAVPKEGEVLLGTLFSAILSTLSVGFLGLGLLFTVSMVALSYPGVQFKSDIHLGMSLVIASFTGYTSADINNKFEELLPGNKPIIFITFLILVFMIIIGFTAHFLIQL